jgi:hypothetical protein
MSGALPLIILSAILEWRGTALALFQNKHSQMPSSQLFNLKNMLKLIKMGYMLVVETCSLS